MALDERELFEIFSGIPAPVVVLRGERAIYANDAARALFGEGAAELPAEALIPRELREGQWVTAGAKVPAAEGEAQVEIRRFGELTVVTASAAADPGEETRALAASVTEAVLSHLSVGFLAAELVSDRARENSDVASLTYLSMLDRALHGIARVTNNAARLFNGFEGEYKPVALDLAQLVGDMVTTTAALARQSDVKFRFVPPDTPVVYMADPVKLELLLMELFSNSLKHTSPGGTVTAAVRVSHTGVLVTVSDTGEGVRGPALDHIFNRYSRPRTDEAKAGAGMGLALAQSIAQAHGGSLMVESSPKGGTSVTLSLPASGLTARDLDLNQPVARSTTETILTQYADVLDSSVYLDKRDM